MSRKADSRIGQRFIVVTVPADGDLTAGSAGFDETKPTLLIRNPAGSGRRLYVNDILWNQRNALSDDIHIMVLIDRVERISAAGQERTPKNMNAKSNRVPLSRLEENSTLTAPGGSDDPREVGYITSASNKGAPLGLDFEGGIVLDPGFLCAFYIFDIGNSTAPEGRYSLELEEEPR